MNLNAPGRIMFFSQIIFVQYILNAIQRQRPFREVILIVALMGVFAILFRLMEDWYTDSYSEKTNHIIYARVSRKIFEKSAELELRSYEDPEFYNSFIKAAKESRENILTFLFNMAEAISCVFSIILTGSVMLTLDPVVIIFSLLRLAISYTIDKKLTKLQYNLTMDNIPAKRKEDYVQRTIYLNDYAKEYRLFPVFKVMLRDFKAAVNEVQGNIEQYGRRMALLQFCSSLFKRILIPMGSMMYIVFRMLVSKTLLIGDGLALINAVSRLTWMIYNVTDCVIKFQEMQLYADNLKNFLEYTPRIQSAPDAIAELQAPFTIEFRNISFTYPGQEEPTLNNLNLTIAPGQKVCIVGRNGAGKTTLVKLLLRLYDPDEGTVLVNGMDIRRYDLECYRRQIGTVFQDSRVFALSIAENVLSKTPDCTQERDAVEHARRRTDTRRCGGRSVRQGCPRDGNALSRRGTFGQGGVGRKSRCICPSPTACSSRRNICATGATRSGRSAMIFPG